MTRYSFKLPDLGEGTVEAELLNWHVRAGDVVRQDQIIAEVMTEKAAVELPSPVAGRVVRLTGGPGDVIPVGTPLIEFETLDERPAESVSPAARASRIKASPATRRRAHEAGLDLRSIQGSGPRGLITAADVAEATSKPAADVAEARSEPAVDVAEATSKPAGESAGPETQEIRVTGLRRVIAERMAESKRTIPHFGYVEEVDVTELESLRKHLNSRRPDSAAQLSYLPFIIVGLVRALERFPQCNAVFDAGRNVVVRHRAVHVGVATQTPEGLMVPVLRHAESMSLTEIGEQILALAQRARARRSTKAELSGSTITVSSLGKLGGVSSTPVINAPEVAIIGVNKVADTVRSIDGAIVVRKTMNLSSAFDHRCVDGYEAASMVQELRMMLEHPATLFMR
ncbi:MAG: dihydrolipoamide acetyltransferase family protein [Gammaproteobacteria bacterium]